MALPHARAGMGGRGDRRLRGGVPGARRRAGPHGRHRGRARRGCRTTGLRIEGRVAQFVQRVDASTPDELQGRFDCVLLAVKAQHTAQAVEQLLPHLADHGVVVSLQNGLNEQTIADRVGASRTIAGFVNFAADYIGPGHIDYGNRGAITLGEMSGGCSPGSSRLRRCCALRCRHRCRAGCLALQVGQARLRQPAVRHRTRERNDGRHVSDPEHRPLLIALAREVLLRRAAAGVDPLGFDGFVPAAFESPSQDAAAESLARMADHYRHSTKQRSGVWRDLAVRKRKTEVDTQIAEIVRVASAQGSDAPVTRRLIALIREIENGTRVIERSNLRIRAAHRSCTADCVMAPQFNPQTDTAAEFAGRTVFITGAAGGYGGELATAFQQLGAQLVLTDVAAALPATLALPPGIVSISASEPCRHG